MKAVVFDIETSFLKVYTFGLFNQNIPHTAILEDWYILTAAWKTLGQKKVEAACITDFKQKNSKDDYGVVKALRDALADADLLIGQNIDKFDIKKLNARLIYHRLPPLPLIPTIDTLKEIRRVAKFTSHRLDFLGKQLAGHGKLDNPGDLWHKCMEGDAAALKHMVKYNKIDVVRTEELYEIIKPYINSGVHMGVLNKNGKVSCKNCGSPELKKNGIRYTATGMVRQEYQCKTCGSYMKLPITKKEAVQRKLI
jgi:DNA polymerase III epsilon subunit-like protein